MKKGYQMLVPSFDQFCLSCHVEPMSWTRAEMLYSAFCPEATVMHNACSLFIQLLITLFTLVIIHPLIIAVPNVLTLNILLLMSSHLKGAPSGHYLVFFF